MAKPRTKTVYRCSECGATAPQWVGRCPACEAWSTLIEEIDEPAGRQGTVVPLRPIEAAIPVGTVDLDEWRAESTGIDEVDRVLGGGLVPGSVTLVGGEPGVGKSTLLLQMAASMARRGQRVLYLSAEESRQQVRLRADRVGAVVPTLWLASDTSMPALFGQVDEVQPDVLIVDSIQTVHDPELSSAAGSVAQVRQCAAGLVQLSKTRGVSTVLVGHVTKDGALAGPRVLEHLVDTVLSFDGDRHHALRLLRAVKHRFGATDHLGVFEMVGAGLEPVPDPSSLFLADRRAGVPGSVVLPTLEGYRPLLVEVQALVAKSNLPSPRRSAQGVDGGRLATVLAVLEQRANVVTSGDDVYVSAIGGIRVNEPGADLAIALAVASSVRNVAMPGDLVACGEIGLGGELRQVHQCDRRLIEAARLGFTRAVLPRHAPDPPAGMVALRATTLDEAIVLAGIQRR